MKTASDPREDDTLDALLAHAPRYAPQAGFADRVLAALQEEEAAAFAPARPRPWYARPYGWGSVAAAACLIVGLFMLPLMEQGNSLQADALALDDAVLVEEVLDTIDDPDLVSAICSVSIGAYGGGQY